MFKRTATHRDTSRQRRSKDWRVRSKIPVAAWWLLLPQRYGQ
jgi:hypothetical protein